MDAEREQIAWGFGLTGAERADEPWAGAGAYWYEGGPEWAEEDFRGAGRYSRDYDGPDYRTLVMGALFGGPDAEIQVPDGGPPWRLVRYYRSSGETECPERQGGAPVADEECPLCEEPEGAEHGFIYLGD